MTHVQLQHSLKKRLLMLCSQRIVTILFLFCHFLLLVIPIKKETALTSTLPSPPLSWIHELPKNIHLTQMIRTQNGLNFTCQGSLTGILSSLSKMTHTRRACFTSTRIHQDTHSNTLLWQGHYLMYQKELP